MATMGVQMKFQGVQNGTFEENPQENERIYLIYKWAFRLCTLYSQTDSPAAAIWDPYCFYKNIIEEWLPNWFVHSSGNWRRWR